MVLSAITSGAATVTAWAAVWGIQGQHNINQRQSDTERRLESLEKARQQDSDTLHKILKTMERMERDSRDGKSRRPKE